MTQWRWIPAGLLFFTYLVETNGFAAQVDSEDLAALFEDVPAQSLFDGKTFDGWEGDLKWFRIEDGAVVAGTLDERIPHNQFLCTEKSYGDFELRLKVRAAGNANGGIQLRSRRIPGSSEVSGYQADVGWNFWGCLYDESRRNRMLATADEAAQEKAVRNDDWNDYLIRVAGDRIQLYVNGVKTVDYVEREQGIAREGIIGLQIHSGPPTEVWYRDVTIKALPIRDAG